MKGEIMKLQTQKSIKGFIAINIIALGLTILPNEVKALTSETKGLEILLQQQAEEEKRESNNKISKVDQKELSKSLLEYYKKIPQEIIYNPYTVSIDSKTENQIKFYQNRGPEIDVSLTEKRYNKVKDENELDVFVVPENSGKEIATKSIGGVTKPNTIKYKDYVKSLSISVSEITKEKNITYKNLYADDQFPILKEEVSLKELDFKLRNILIEKYDLYKEDKLYGKIIVHTNDNNRYTFELDKKLQDYRMSDVTQVSNIKNIEVILERNKK